MIVDRIYEWAKCQPDKTAVIWNDVSVSYLSFANAIRANFDFFQQENLPVGRTAIVLVHNLLDAWLIIMALRALGLNTIAVTSIAAADALKIRDVACVVITQAEAASSPGLVAKAPSDAKILVVPQLHRSGPPEDLYPCSSSPFGGHILYTSGTTGVYKKLMMSSEHEDRRNSTRAQFWSFNRNTIGHSLDFGLWTGTGFKGASAIWHAGGCVVLDQSDDKFKNFFLNGPTFSHLVPPMLKDLLQTRGPLARPIDGFAIAVGGGFLSIDLVEQSIQKLTDRITFWYGATELIPNPLRSEFRTKDDQHWLMPMKERLVQVIDKDGRECAPDQEGELRVQLSDIDCTHYLDDEETSARIFRDGFFYPGDMAVRRQDGRIRILGRVADVVILQGVKIAVTPIEQSIQRDLKVDEVCIFSGLNKQGYEEVVVAIQSNREIEKTKLEGIARKFFPSARVRFAIHREFPRTETGTRKVKRALLKKLLFEETDGQAGLRIET
jgi:acyl-coenzyme A synthetase/AMP-(fatty) acid ligase